MIIPMLQLRGGSFMNSTEYGHPTTYREAASFSDREDELYSLRLVIRGTGHERTGDIGAGGAEASGGNDHRVSAAKVR
jgi:hypothetical protein